MDQLSSEGKTESKIRQNACYSYLSKHLSVVVVFFRDEYFSTVLLTSTCNFKLKTVFVMWKQSLCHKCVLVTLNSVLGLLLRGKYTSGKVFDYFHILNTVYSKTFHANANRTLVTSTP